MCRNIKTLFNFDPPATDEEIRAASLQFVRKLSGFNAPSKANAAAFESPTIVPLLLIAYGNAYGWLEYPGSVPISVNTPS